MRGCFSLSMSRRMLQSSTDELQLLDKSLHISLLLLTCCLLYPPPSSHPSVHHMLPWHQRCRHSLSQNSQPGSLTDLHLLEHQNISSNTDLLNPHVFQSQSQSAAATAAAMAGTINTGSDSVARSFKGFLGPIKARPHPSPRRRCLMQRCFGTEPPVTGSPSRPNRSSFTGTDSRMPQSLDQDQMFHPPPDPQR